MCGSVKLPIRAKLVLGLGAAILLVAAGGAHPFVSLRAVGGAVEEVRRDGEAARAALSLATSLREQYAHEAHVLLMPDGAEHAHHFNDATAATRRWLEKLRAVTAETGDRDLVDAIAAESEEFIRLFEGELFPAFERGEREAALRAHARSEVLLESVARRGDELSRRFLDRSQKAQQAAEGLVSRAVEVGGAFLIALVVLAGAVASYLVHAIHRPIRALVAGTKAVAAGDLDTKIESQGADEFGALAASFNEMTSTLRANQEELLRTERIAALVPLVAGVAHQLNNPLGVILGYAGMLDDARYDEAARRKAAAEIRREALECRTIVVSLMSLARPGALDLDRAEARDLVERVLEKAGRYVRLDALDVRSDVPDGLALETDLPKLEQALLNLVVNAAEAMPRGGSLTVSVERGEGGVRIAISDSGPGIAEADLSRVFAPYYTTKAEGTGLGIPFAEALVGAIGGSLAVDSAPGRGARFEIRLPAGAGDRA